MTADLVVRGGTVVDGLGNPPVEADVVVAGGRISALVPRGTRVDAGEVLDADGLTVTPGFVDMHSHSDVRILAEPDHPARLLQGVTTEVLGQDGLSYAPVDDATLARLRTQLKGWNDDPPGFDWSWRSVGDYLDRLDGRVAVNTAYLVPQGTVRLLVVGADDRPASPDELRRMRAVVRQSLAEGAVGMSSGLTYVPGMYADTDELVALNEVVAQAGGYFCPHHRNYGSRVLESYGECLEIARRTGVALHLAHCHVSFPVNAGRVGELVSMLDEAAAAGVDVSFDSYPYLAAMTSLHAVLPGWAQSGGTEDQLARLADPAARARIVHELDVVGTDGNQGLPVDWSTVVVSGMGGAPGYPDVVGRSVADSARERGVAPAELCLDLVAASRFGASCLMYVGIEEHVRTLMRHPRHTVGSDGILVGDRPHPRGWGTFPRVLGRYVREEGVLDLVEAVRHMTSSAADRIGAPDRGRIAAGAAADLVVLDPETVLDLATYEDPRRGPAGIPHVIVNGAVAVRDGHLTGSRSGRVVRRTRPHTPSKEN